MKHFYIIMNSEKDGVKKTAGEILEYLNSRGAQCLFSQEAAAKKPGGGKPPSLHSGERYGYTDASSVPEETQCIITLGGDGTLIQASRDLAGRHIPILGINRGTLGYLTQISRAGDIKAALDALLQEDFTLERRMMLSGEAYRAGELFYQDLALNEIVMTRNERLNMLKFKVCVNGQFLNEYRADGLIAATPTGSTAYNLSAGGPIIVPDSQMMVLTPICSHALNARSLVLSADASIRIEVLGGADGSQAAVFDGDTAVDLCSGDYLEIGRSKVETVLVKLKDVSFLDNLRSKMAGI